MTEKLFEYAKQRAENTWEGCHGCTENDKNMRNGGFREGMAHAIALGLPQRFAKWMTDDDGISEVDKAFASYGGIIENEDHAIQVCYDYWTENVLNLEDGKEIKSNSDLQTSESETGK